MSMDDTRVACPHCDTLHRFSPEHLSARTACIRCGAALTLGKRDAVARVVGLALTSAILMCVVMFAPFLSLDAGPFASAASVVDVVMSFSSETMVLLSAAVLAFIILIPLARSLLLVYALVPLLREGRSNAPGARAALRWAYKLKPWAMAEIFMVGVAVALVKLAGMASVDAGPAFWAMAALVVVNVFQDTNMCRNTLWTALSSRA